MLIVKFGGSSLTTGESITKAAELVVQSNEKEKVIIVSAVGKTTEHLLKLINDTKVQLDFFDVASIFSIGERTATILVAATLRSLKQKVEIVDPEHPAWPIAAKNGPLSADPDIPNCNIDKFKELLQDNIIVMPGFLGINNGHVVTLGRGGSDTTAVVMGNLLGASEVVLVKDVEGVMDADPNIVPNAKILNSINASAMHSLSLGGAKIVAANSLKYQLPAERIRIIPFGVPLDSRVGTEIVADDDLSAISPGSVLDDKIAAVTVLVDNVTDGLKDISSLLDLSKIKSISANNNHITLFVNDEDVIGLVRYLHVPGVFKGISSRIGLKRIRYTVERGEILGVTLDNDSVEIYR